MAESSEPYKIRWGILATGGIAKTFTTDLLLDPKSRGVTDVAHEVAAAASSRSKDQAAKFLSECGAPPTAKAYGNYKDLVADPDLDIIYVATPHSHHYQNVRLCLEAGKNVLCEKAFTVNAEQAKILVNLAREKGLFLMEAVWTRYFPISVELRDLVKRGTIGKVYRVFADLSFNTNPEESFGTDHRMVNLDLAGGALLDLGIYSLTWIFQILYHIVPADKRGKPTVAGLITKYPQTGADESTSIVMTFPPDNAHGICTTTIRVADDPDKNGTAGPPIRIQGSLGEIQVFGPAFKPLKYRLIPASSEAGFSEGDVSHQIESRGMYWEADECARCLRDGKKESDSLSLEESIVMMEVMDEVRKQNGLVYPEKIESTDYPLEGF